MIPITANPERVLGVASKSEPNGANGRVANGGIAVCVEILG